MKVKLISESHITHLTGQQRASCPRTFDSFEDKLLLSQNLQLHTEFLNVKNLPTGFTWAVGLPVIRFASSSAKNKAGTEGKN